MKVTDELHDRVWQALQTQPALHPHAERDAVRFAIQTALADLPEPSSTIIELNKRVRALQIKLEKARKAGFVGEDT